MPRFPEMEEAFGSVIRGVLAQRRAARKRGAATEASSSGARYGLFTTPAKGLGDPGWGAGTASSQPPRNDVSDGNSGAERRTC
ncbi:MAG UNVERIFIED_CONTAM: hypothetical protein LVR18_17430 [Planctomycetaceae bacterium]